MAKSGQNSESSLIIRANSAEICRIHRLSLRDINFARVKPDVVFLFRHVNILSVQVFEQNTLPVIGQFLSAFADIQLNRSELQVELFSSFKIEANQQTAAMSEILRPLRRFKMRILWLDFPSALTLTFNSFQSDLFDEFTEWHESLVLLRLCYLKVGQIEANVFANFKNLCHLRLDRIGLREIDPHAFRSLHNLVYLDLSENSLQSLRAGTLDCLVSLERLDLNYNLLRRVERGLFLRLSKLRYLNLSSNPLQVAGLDEDTLEGLCALEKLYLLDTPLAKCGMERSLRKHLSESVILVIG